MAQANDNSYTIRQVLTEHDGFVISPNMQAQVRTADDDSFMASLILEAAESFNDPNEANARLLQVRSDMKAFIEEMKRALSAGEPEESDYIKGLVSKITVLIQKEEQLKALAA